MESKQTADIRPEIFAEPRYLLQMCTHRVPPSGALLSIMETKQKVIDVVPKRT